MAMTRTEKKVAEAAGVEKVIYGSFALDYEDTGVSRLGWYEIVTDGGRVDYRWLGRNLDDVRNRA